MLKTLDAGEKHLLNLTRKNADADGWAKVSLSVMLAIKSLPHELIDIRETDSTGYARLTEKGNSIVEAMAWL